MKKLSFLLFALCIVNFLSAQEIELVEFASGFDSPLDITNAGDERLFIVERDGVIKILNPDGSIEQGEFLDIDNIVTSCGGSCEIGLLGLAFHPDFANNGYFYVNYTATGGGDTHVSRFSVSEDNPNVADMNSEVILLDVSQPYGNHNGGCIKFGPDGYLYIGMGDGGAGGDPQNFSQNRQSLLGKMLRIDVDNGTTYSIPEDNPFANDDETLDEIWSLGLRNPWRFSFDSETGDMWIADVGQNAWEEVDFEPAGMGGLNYGWRCREGQHNFNTSGCPDNSELTDPIHEYVTSNSFGDGCSITGGFVYRGCLYPELYGKYIYGDYCSSRIWALTPNGDGSFSNEELLNFNNNQIAGFGEDINGELYMAAIGQGRIYRVTETTNPLQFAGSITNASCPEEADGAINLIATGENNTFQWSNEETTEDITGLLSGEYTVTITTESGCEIVESFTVSAPVLAVPVITNDNGTLSVDAEFTNVQWLLEGDIVAEGNSFTPSQTGDYTAVYTTADGCSVSSESVSIIVSDIEDIEGMRSLFISPNPFKDVVQIQLQSDLKTDLTLRILSVEGKEMYTEKVEVEGTLTRSVNLTDLPSGVYFLHAGNTEGELVQKLVKE